MVVKVRRKEVYSPEGVRRSLAFGGVDLLMWDLVQLRFGRLEQDAESGIYPMFPLCCGRGAGCPHLLATDRRQWPNGDDLDLRVLQAIPEAFAGVLRNELQRSGW